MKEYKVGDKVKIRNDLEPDQAYGLVVFVDLMSKYMGREATLKKYINTPFDAMLFQIDIDEAGFFWDSSMFE